MDNRRLALKALFAGAVAPAVSAAPVKVIAQAAPKSPAALHFPNFIATTHENKQVRIYDDLLEGKFVLINMMYTVCATTCPPNTLGLMQVQEALGNRVGRDIHMYSISLMPEIDDPAALRDYMKRYGITKPGWTFLRIARPEMEILRRKLGFYDIEPERDKDLSLHAGAIRLGNVPLHRWAMVPAQGPTHQIVSSINGMI
jgi:protein SCO1/2